MNETFAAFIRLTRASHRQPYSRAREQTTDPEESIRVTASRGSLMSQSSRRDFDWQGTSEGVQMASTESFGGGDFGPLPGSMADQESGDLTAPPTIDMSLPSFDSAGGLAGSTETSFERGLMQELALESADPEAEMDVMRAAGEALQSESRLFKGGAAIPDVEVLEDDDDGAIAKIIKVRCARGKLDAPPPLPKGKLAEGEKKLLTKLFNKKKGNLTSIVDIVQEAAKVPSLGAFKSLSRKVNEAAMFTNSLRNINKERMERYKSKPQLMMSDMERKLKEADDEADRLEEEALTVEERRQLRVQNKMVRGVSSKSVLTSDEQKSAVDGVTAARQAGNVNLDLAMDEARVDSPTFQWQPMSRVTLATELPLELFEEEEEEIFHHPLVMKKEVSMMMKTVKTMPSKASKVGPTTVDSVYQDDRRKETRRMFGVQTQKNRLSSPSLLSPSEDDMDEEYARELARQRRERALDVSQRYDANIKEHLRAAQFGNRPMSQGPMSHSRNTQMRPALDIASKTRAQHYSKWYLPTSQLSLPEYRRKHADYLERVGGEQSRIQRQLNEKQEKMTHDISSLASSRLYKEWLHGNPDVRRVPHYMRKIPLGVARKRRESGDLAEEQSSELMTEDSGEEGHSPSKVKAYIDPFMKPRGVNLQV